MGSVVTIVTMASVRISIVLYSVILTVSGLWSGDHHDSYGAYGGRHHRRAGVRRRVVVVRERPREHHVHVTHEVRHVPAVLDTCHGCHQGFEGSVSVVSSHHHHRDPRPDVVVVDHGGADYLPAPRVAVAVEPRPVYAVAAAPAVVEPVPTTAVVQETYGGSRIDPRLIPVLRGSSPQEGDPLGIYPGGGLDSRIDPALLPEARAQLGDEVRLLQTQLEILTRRLGVTSRGQAGGDATLDAGLLL